MGYLVVLFTIIAIVALTIYVRANENIKTEIVLLVVYLIGVLVITLFSREFDIYKQPLLNPFAKYHLIAKRLCYHGKNDGIIGIWRVLNVNESIISELILNILLFVPLGILVPSIVRFFRRWWRVLLIGLSFSAAIEITQLFTHYGCFEMVDLINNALGALIGYGLYRKIVRKKNMNLEPDG